MKKALAVVTVISLSLMAQASSDCPIEGAGQVEVRCENAPKGIRATLSGMDEGSIHYFNLFTKEGNFQSNVEVDLPGIAHQRVDEKVFTFSGQSEGNSLKITGLPRTFSGTRELDQGGLTVTYNGTFKAILNAYLNSNEKLLSEIQVSCRYKVRSCPRGSL